MPAFPAENYGDGSSPTDQVFFSIPATAPVTTSTATTALRRRLRGLRHRADACARLLVGGWRLERADLWSAVHEVRRVIELVPTALVRNALYFLNYATNSILKYELTTQSMSVIHLPPDFSVAFALLTTMEDGGLGFTRVEDSKLFLWSIETGAKGDAEWVQIRVIQLETLPPVDASSISYGFVGFAHGVGLFFVGTDDGFSVLISSMTG
uniref:F-box protein AT5G49610-like beta-propeller domain-containing protein n=1 Tax=Arundo donax TaxID=35708 RepID=A0A0A8ZH52_ARUDO